MSDAITLNQLLTLYEQDILPTKAPATQYQTSRIFLKIRHDLGHIFLTDLTPAVLRQWRDTLKARGYQPGSVRRFLFILSGVLSAAVKEFELLAENPLRKIRYPAEQHGRVRYLSDEERHRLLDACQQSRCAALYPLVMLALATGGRKQELLQLRWVDVDLEQGSVRFLHTKNKHPRSVPMEGPALEVLRAWAPQQPAGMGYVFPSVNGAKGRHVTSAWYMARERAGLPGFRFHDLRHSFASYLAMSGASLIEIADLLGHKTLAMVRLYAHLSPAHTRGVVSRMAQQFLSCVLAALAWRWVWWDAAGPQTLDQLGHAVGWW
jgi:integrase